MKIRGIGRVKLWARRCVAPFTSQVVILLYHRVFDAPSDPQLLCVHPDRFNQHLGLIRRNYALLSLGGLVQALKEQRLPKRAVVVTFDDGYADNLQNALPLLRRHGIPATFFVAGLNIGNGCEFWWDELERLLLLPGHLPAQIRLSIAGKEYSWDLGKAGEYSAADFCQYCHWNVLDKHDPTARQSLYRSLCDLLCHLADQEREPVLQELRRLAGQSRQGRPTHRSLSSSEILQLSSGGLAEVGAHTMTHPSLSALPVAAQAEEIRKNKQQLEEILGARLKGFSYPFGTLSDYTGETIRVVQECGFAYAVANYRSTTRKSADLFQLPRFTVRDWDGDIFIHYLNAWFRQ